MRFLILLLILLIPATAEAQQSRCVPRERMVELLKDYDESSVAAALVGSDVIELFVSGDQETWTLFFTNPAGVSCIIAVGKEWAWTGETRPGRHMVPGSGHPGKRTEIAYPAR